MQNFAVAASRDQRSLATLAKSSDVEMGGPVQRPELCTSRMPQAGIGAVLIRGHRGLSRR
jgi:hypothetical protein